MVLAVRQDGGLAEDVLGPLVVHHLLHVEYTSLRDSGASECDCLLLAEELLSHTTADLAGLVHEPGHFVQTVAAVSFSSV